MSERSKRERRRYDDDADRSRRHERDQYGRDEPWREERRSRDFDEPGHREFERHRRDAEGHGYGYGFGDSSTYRPTSWPGQRSEWRRRDEDPQWNRGAWDPRQSTGGYGSQFDAWRSGAGFGFGPEEAPRGFRDEREDNRGDYRGRGPKDYRRSDDRICEEICDRLTDAPDVDASEVSVRVESGEVTLSGFVATRDQKRRAEETVERVSGVDDVINQLRVNRDAQHLQPSQGQRQPDRGQRAASSPQQASVAADRER